MSDSVRPSAQLPSDRVLENIKVWSRLSFLAMVATVGSTSYPGWFAMVTAVLAVLTFTLATVTLVKMVGSKFPAFSVVLMVMVMLWSLFLGFAALVQLIFVDATVGYAECLQQAVTLSRQQQCTSQMSDGLLQQLMGQ
ncbi:MAG: hypothetical protein Q4A03_06365 [Rothia sp. (in: high G+C Gram-positive bacteria)]|uniref:hypothetical protein n=1 Tax=Rothia sp. (in: high G+C Gram-positive bacteria) TaxID=1885016 RepID=UPI0026FB8782|nr:hypothetical protein [Rothia sp. (in: high G+C Gram-positive bacteria)]